MKTFPLAATLGAAAVTLFPAIVLAEEITSLGEIVVTADRMARTADETLTPVSIITRADIERYQATSVPDVLRRIPGINISNSGGVGKATSVFLRGSNSGHVLVLVDGVAIGSATLGTVAFQDLPLEQVERIEVVRGPRSSLYGSEAIGGVIQIFTRKGGDAGKSLLPEIKLSAGSHSTQQASANFGGGNDLTWYNLNLSHDQTDGFDATTDGSEPDDDGYQRTAASLRVGHRFDNGAKLEVSALHSEAENDYDGSFVNQSEVTQQVLSGQYQQSIGERVLVTARVGQSLDKSDNFKDGVFTSRFDTQRDSASLQADVATGNTGNLTLGLDRQTDKIDSTTAYTVSSRDNTGVFVAWQQGFGQTGMEVSARHDDNEQFGQHTTGSLAIGHELGNGLRLQASYGTAFKAPTFNQLYFPGFGAEDLEPEESTNTEIGVSGTAAAGKVRWAANVFNNEIDNLISYPPPTFAVSQTDKARIRGLELEAGTQMAGWDVNANLTVQEPENRSGADAGKTLVLRPQHMANVDIDRTLGKLRLGAGVHAEGKRYTDAANTESTKLPGYSTLDLRAEYQVAKNWTVGAKIGNVLDKDYQTNNRYHQDGVNGLVTVKFVPK